MNNTQRKSVLAQYDKLVKMKQNADASLKGSKLRVERLEERETRANFYKKPPEKILRHSRRLARERDELRQKVEFMAKLDGELYNVEQKLAG